MKRITSGTAVTLDEGGLKYHFSILSKAIGYGNLVGVFKSQATSDALDLGDLLAEGYSYLCFVYLTSLRERLTKIGNVDEVPLESLTFVSGSPNGVGKWGKYRFIDGRQVRTGEFDRNDPGVLDCPRLSGASAGTFVSELVRGKEPSLDLPRRLF